MKYIVFVLGLNLLVSPVVWAQSVIQLPGTKAPGSDNQIGSQSVRSDSLLKTSGLPATTTPTLTAFFPDSALATGTAVLVFPAIGLANLSANQDNTALATRLTTKGLAVFVLTYKPAQGTSPTATGQQLSPQDSLTARAMALTDGKEALSYLRQHAAELGIRPDQVGVLGISTGGAPALQLAYDHTETTRPTFVSLLRAEVSTIATQSVPTDAPVLFIAALSGATSDNALQTAELYQQWLRAGRSAELHSYALSNQPAGSSLPDLVPDVWLDQWTDWLNRQGYLQTRSVVQANQPVVAGNGVIPNGTPAVQPSSPQPKTPATTSPQTGSQRPTAPGRSTEVITAYKTPGESTGTNRLLSLSGTVRDSSTGRGLPKATILVDYEKVGKGTYTNEQGQFLLNLSAGKHIIVVRNVGYLPFRTTLFLRGNTTLNVSMPSVASQLEEVVVTSKGYDRTVREPLLGVSQISMKTLERVPAALGEVDILRGLQLLPGVTSVGEAANGVNIRGGTTDQNLILMDDTPIFNPTHMFGLFSVFPPDAVSGLDLYKGNVPARYGGRAASVLDISLKNPSLDQFKLTGGVSLVSNKLTLDVPLVKGKVGLLVSGRGAFNSALLHLASDQLSDIKADFGDVVAKVFWRAGEHNTVTAMGYFSKDFFQTNLLGSLASINATGTQYRNQTANGMVRWFHTITPRLNLQTTAIIAQYVPDIISIETVTANKVTLRQSLLQRQFKTNLNYQTERAKTEIGLNVAHYRLNPGELLPGSSVSVNYQKTPTENALETAIYADHEVSLTDRLAVSAGLRYSYFMNLGPATVRQYAAGEAVDQTTVVDSIRYGAGQVTAHYGGFEPRLGIRYSVGSTASVKIGYNLMRQYLQVITNTTTPLPTARWKTADANIQPQVSQLLSAGWFQNLKNNIYELTAEVYWRTTQHILDYKPGANFLLQPYPETQLLQGRSKAYGLEVMMSKKKGELTGWVNYTYSRTFNQVIAGADFTQQINGGDWYRANYDRPHSFNASLNINQGKHHSFSFNFVYSTGRPYTAPEGFVRYQDRNYPYYNERNQERLPAYHRLDFAWNIYNPSLKDRRWQGHWTFTVYNLYGRKNAYSIYYRTEGQATTPYRLAIFAAPIPSLSYNFEFK